MKVAITGSTGFIGNALTKALIANGDQVIPITRKTISSEHILWDPKAGTIDTDAFNAAKVDAVIHLAGEGIAEKKWTDEQKREILESRTKGTHLISETIGKLDKKPSIFISSSAIGYYGDRADEVLDETSTHGDTFQAQVCIAWEENVEPAIKASIPTAIIRTGMVLDKDGGALKRMVLPFKLGAGGKIGSGNQYMSWISLTDEIRAIQYILENKLEGTFNLTAPAPVTNSEFTKALGKRVSRPTILPTPLLPLKIIYGPELVGELLLGSTRVVPKALQAAGFKFEHETIEEAFLDVV